MAVKDIFVANIKKGEGKVIVKGQPQRMCSAAGPVLRLGWAAREGWCKGAILWATGSHKDHLQSLTVTTIGK